MRGSSPAGLPWPHGPRAASRVAAPVETSVPARRPLLPERREGSVVFRAPSTRGEVDEHGHRRGDARRGAEHGDRRSATTPALAAADRARAGRTAGSARARSTRPNPAATGRAATVADRPKLYVLDMFPYPSGAGLHVGHPLGYIGTDVCGRYLRMTGHNVLHTMGFDAFGLPAEQYAVQTGTHPRTTTEANIAALPRRSCAGWAWPTTSAAASPPPTPSSTAGPSGSSCRSSTPGTTSEQRRARPIAELVAELDAGTPRPTPDGPAVGRAGRSVERRARRRRAPAGLPRRGAGQLVPRAGHGAGQRGGHRRRAQRARQLPGVPPQPAAVDDADHRLRRPAARRPGPAGLAGVGQADAAQLDRPLRRARGSGSRSSAPAGDAIEVFTTRPDTLFGATYMVLAPEHPLVDALTAGAWPDGTDPRWTGGAATPAEAVAAYRGAAARKSELDRQENKDKTGVFTGAFAVNPVNGQRDPGVHRRLRADGLRHRRDHGRARRRTSATGSSPRRSACRSSAPCSRPTAGTARPTPATARRSTRQRRDRAGRAGRRRGQARDHRLAGRQGRGRGDDHLQAARLAVQPAALLGRAVPDRLRRGRPADRRCPTTMLPVALPEVDDYSPKTFDPTTTPTPSPSRRWPARPSGRTSSWTWATARRPTAARPTRCRSGPAPAGTTCATWTRRRRALLSTRRSSSTGWAATRRAGRPRRRRPVRRRRRARRAAPAVRPVLAQGAVRPGPRVSEEPFRRLFNQGYIQAYAYTDERGFYVPADEVVEDDGRWSSRARASRSPASTGRWASA